MPEVGLAQGGESGYTLYRQVLFKSRKGRMTLFDLICILAALAAVQWLPAKPTPCLQASIVDDLKLLTTIFSDI